MKKLTTAEFIERARKVHGDKYNYSKVEYTTSHKKVIIVCPDHGEFLQLANSHLSGKECVKCGIIKRANSKRIKLDEFLERSRAAHGDKYDYSHVIFTGAKNKVEIICQKHGAFKQIPQDHWAGKGCITCGRENTSNARRFTTPQFISKASQLHYNKYDYSRTIYLGWEQKVWIGCPTHGFFQQRGGDHLTGKGCPRCGRIIVETARRFTRKDFIDKAKTVHGETYDYSPVEYVNSETKVTIICKVHGPFDQKPNNHLQGKGCIKCAGKDLKTTKEFIEQAKIIHSDKYDYTLVNYKGANKYVVIICPEHGEFKQWPTNHLQGKGCRRCTWGGFDSSKPGILYYLKVSANERSYYKIGITNKSVVARYNKRDLKKIDILKEWHFEIGQDAFDQEFSVLQNYSGYLYSGPDLLTSGNSEIFFHDVLGLDPE